MTRVTSGDVERLSKEISLALQPMLKGRPPELQGAVLADLLSLWIAMHAPPLREEILTMHIAAVRSMIPESERQIFGPAGFPTHRQ